MILTLPCFKSHVASESTFSILRLNQLITQPVRVTCSTETLIDHTYTINQNLVQCIIICTYHCHQWLFPVLCTWSMKLPQRAPERSKPFRTEHLNDFNKDTFLLLFYSGCAHFYDVHMFNNPDDAMSAWYDITMPVINVHALLLKKRVKHKITTVDIS